MNARPGFLAVVARGIRNVDSVDWKSLLTRREDARRAQAERDRRWAKWRPWIVAGGGLVFAALVVGLVFFTPFFRVGEVSVAGAELIDRARVQSVSGAEGVHVLGVNVDEVANSVETLPQVESVSVSRSFPSTVSVEVVERRPVAVLNTDPAVLVDADGVVLGEAHDRDESGFPSVEATGDPPEVGTVWSDESGRIALSGLGELPESARTTLQSAGVGDRGFEALVRDGPRVIFGPETDLAQKGNVLADVLRDVRARALEIEYVDLTSPLAPAIKR